MTQNTTVLGTLLVCALEGDVVKQGRNIRNGGKDTTQV
jgi:hypothetical protein